MAPAASSMAGAPGPAHAELQGMVHNPYAPVGPYGPMYASMPQMYGMMPDAYPYSGYMPHSYVGAPMYASGQDMNFGLPPPHMHGMPLHQPTMYDTSTDLTQHSSLYPQSTSASVPSTVSVPPSVPPTSNTSKEPGTNAAQSQSTNDNSTKPSQLDKQALPNEKSILSERTSTPSLSASSKPESGLSLIHI